MKTFDNSSSKLLLSAKNAPLKDGAFGAGRSHPVKTSIIYRYDSDGTPTQEPVGQVHQAPEPKTRTPLFAVGLVFLFLAATFGAYYFGLSTGSSLRPTSGSPAIAAETVPAFPAHEIGAFDAAIKKIRNGDPASAIGELKRLREQYPEAPSLDYAIALAAIHAGDHVLAKDMAASSVRKGERVSDALALTAVTSLNHPPDGTKNLLFVDAQVRRRQFLEQAIAADPLNSGPRIEYASLLRSIGDLDAARHQFACARNLLMPVDSAVVIDSTLALMDAEAGLPMENPPAPTESTPDLLRSVFQASENGDPTLAASLLETIKSRLPYDTFLYIAEDPAFNKLTSLPEIRKTLRQH